MEFCWSAAVGTLIDLQQIERPHLCCLLLDKVDLESQTTVLVNLDQSTAVQQSATQVCLLICGVTLAENHVP